MTPRHTRLSMSHASVDINRRCCLNVTFPLCSFPFILSVLPVPAFVKQRRRVADLSVTAGGKGGQVGVGSLRVAVGQSPTSCAGRRCSISVLSFFSLHQVAGRLLPPAHLNARSACPEESPRAMQISYRRKAKRRCVCRTRGTANRHHPLRSFCAFKRTLRNYRVPKT